MHVLALALLLSVRLVPDSPDVRFSQPQIAVGRDTVGLTFGSGTAIYFSGSQDRGRTFSKPVKVVQAQALLLGMHRGPRIAITPDAIVITAVVGTKSGGSNGDLTAWHSTDKGKTWSAGVRINDVPSAPREGLHTIAAGPGGLLYAAWLDLRSKGTRLYGASSRDGGVTWSANTEIYANPSGTICECCHPSIVIAETGRIYVMWRNFVNGFRDFYFTTSGDGGKTFGAAPKIGQGTWRLDACPMDGGGLALDSNGNLLSVWRREDTIFLAAPGQREVVLAKGKNPAIARGADGVYIAWSGPKGIEAKLPGDSKPILLEAGGDFVHLAGPGPVIAVWENKGAIVVQTLSER